MSLNSHRVTLLASLSVFLLVGVALFPSAGRDDVHITYWAAYALARFGSVVNYNMVHVEQSSSLLQVLLLAAFHEMTGFSVVNIGGVISIFWGACTIIACFYLLGKERLSRGYLMAIATIPPFVYWSFGGLETSLAAFLVSVIVWVGPEQLNKVKWRIVLVLLTALYTLVRPEGGIVMAVYYAVFFLLVDRRRQVFNLLIITLIMFGLLCIWRWSYFGSFFPQPVSAKIGDALIVKWINGLKYLVRMMRDCPLLVLFYAGFLVRIAAEFRDSLECKKPAFSVLSVMIAVQLLFVVFAGGDWMEGARFIVPVMPLLMVVSVLEIKRLLSDRILQYSFLALNIIGCLYFSFGYSTSFRFDHFFDVSNNVKEKYSFFEYMNAIHSRDIAFYEDVMSKVHLPANEMPLIVSQQAGFVMFHFAKQHLGKYRFVDLVGLSTKDMTSCAASGKLQRFSGGVQVGYAQYFALRTSGMCVLPRPDIIFDLDDERWHKLAFLESHGFREISRIQGSTHLGGLGLKNDILNNQFLMVRSTGY